MNQASSLFTDFIANVSRKRKADKDLLMNNIKRACVYNSYYRQSWSMPNTIINYLAKEPSTAKVYQKLTKSCKYFFIKNPIIVADSLYLNIANKWMAHLHMDGKCIDFKRYSYKFWLSDKIIKCDYGKLLVKKLSCNAFSPILTRIYRCDIKELYIYDEIMSFSDFTFLFSKAEDITLRGVTVLNEDRAITPLEDIVKALPFLKFMTFPNNGNITLNTVVELMELTHFTKIKNFKLLDISDLFDIGTFYKYIKKNKHTRFYLSFMHPLPVAYKIQLHQITDEIVATEKHDYEVPYIWFPGIGGEKKVKITSLYYNL